MNYQDLKIDLKELEEDMRRNREERLEFVKKYAEWVKNTPNKTWSSQHKKTFE